MVTLSVAKPYSLRAVGRHAALTKTFAATALWMGGHIGSLW
jgi:hypothetical protein